MPFTMQGLATGEKSGGVKNNGAMEKTMRRTMETVGNVAACLRPVVRLQDGRRRCARGAVRRSEFVAELPDGLGHKATRARAAGLRTRECRSELNAMRRSRRERKRVQSLPAIQGVRRSRADRRP